MRCSCMWYAPCARCSYRALLSMPGMMMIAAMMGLAVLTPGGAAFAQSGACCITGGGLQQCQTLTAKDCAAAGGVFSGPGTACNPAGGCPDTAPIGACCVPGTCFTSTEANCLASGGTFNGAGSTCDPFPCPLPPTGACCLEDAKFCLDTDEVQCAILKGAFHPGQTCADLTDCGKPPPPPPATGACCILGLSGFTCIVTSEASCTSSNGTYHGDGSTCNPASPCDPGTGPSGACCVVGGGLIVCTVVRESICAALGGTFRGKGTTCEDVQCTLGDTNADDVVNVDDLINVILAWGDCPPPPPSGGPSDCPADVNNSGSVDVDDMIMVILNGG